MMTSAHSRAEVFFCAEVLVNEYLATRTPPPRLGELDQRLAEILQAEVLLACFERKHSDYFTLIMEDIRLNID